MWKDSKRPTDAALRLADPADPTQWHAGGASIQAGPGQLVACLITISPDSGARHIALTRELALAERLLGEAGWSQPRGLWFAPPGAKPRYAPPQMPLGIPLLGYFVTCQHLDRDYVIFGESERGARLFLEQALRWRLRGGRWTCALHEALYER